MASTSLSLLYTVHAFMQLSIGLVACVMCEPLGHVHLNPNLQLSWASQQFINHQEHAWTASVFWVRMYTAIINHMCKAARRVAMQICFSINTCLTLEKQGTLICMHTWEALLCTKLSKLAWKIKAWRFDRFSLVSNSSTRFSLMVTKASILVLEILIRDALRLSTFVCSS